MKKSLRALALLPFFLLFCLVPAPRAAGQVHQVFLPQVFSPVSFIFGRVGPSYGRVLNVAQDPHNPSVVYAMTYGSGMYKSVDAGAYWFPISAGISYLTLQAMAVDPVNPNVLYAGTYGDAAYPYNGVFKSHDGGASWAPTGDMINYWNGSPYRNPVVYALEVDPNNPSRVFAGTRMRYMPSGVYSGGGVFRTENGGVSWKAVNTGLPNEDLYVYDLAIDDENPGVVYAALHEHGLYRSDDYGNHWSRVTSLSAWSGRAITVDPFDPDILYFGAVKKQGAFRSSNGGASWSPMGYAGWDVAVGAISADPYHSGRVYSGVILSVTDNRLFRATNPAGSWTTVAYLNAWGHVAFAPDQISAYASSDGDGIYKSTDGGQNWRRSAAGLTGYSVTGLAVSPANPNLMYAALYSRGVYISYDGGANWSPINTGLDNPNVLSIAMDPKSPGILYVTTNDSSVYYTTNGGSNWWPLSSGYPSALSALEPRAASAFENRPLPERDDLRDDPEAPLPRPANLMVGKAQGNAVVISPLDSSVVLTATQGRGISRLVGTNWVATNFTSGTAYAIAFDRFVNARVLAGVAAVNGGIIGSGDNGSTWAPLNQGISDRTVYSLVQHPKDPSIFLAGTDSGVYYSIDSGFRWSPGGLQGQAVKAVSISTEGIYFAGTDTGAYYAITYGGNWAHLNAAFDNVGIQGIVQGPNRTSYFVTRLSGILLAVAR